MLIDVKINLKYNFGANPVGESWITIIGTFGIVLCRSVAVVFYQGKKPTTICIVENIYSTCLCEASLTLSNLPRKGNTPYRSRPTTLRPLTANVLAESPSVKIRVH